jgi:hypothetical protein
MSEKTRKNNDQEDELNQSRFFAERGAEVVDTQSPGVDGPETEEEDILESKSRFREQPTGKGLGADPESEEADKSPFYGQGFGSGDDTGIRRVAQKDNPEERPSLGA